jgi:hypothetical protein
MSGTWKDCRIGSCHRHERCMYHPCRQEPPALKIGDRVPLPKEKLRVVPSRNADVGGKSLRGAFSNGRGRK